MLISMKEHIPPQYVQSRPPRYLRKVFRTKQRGLSSGNQICKASAQWTPRKLSSLFIVISAEIPLALSLSFIIGTVAKLMSLTNEKLSFQRRSLKHVRNSYLFETRLSITEISMSDPFIARFAPVEPKRRNFASLKAPRIIFLILWKRRSCSERSSTITQCWKSRIS